MVIVLDVYHSHDFNVVLPLFKSADILLVYTEHLASNLFIVLTFHLFFNALSYFSEIWVCYYLFPVFFSDGETVELVAHTVVE